MSAPDRETVRAAMNDLAVTGEITKCQRDTLRANARDVARQLREYETAHLTLLPSFAGELADQLNPQP